MAGPAQAPQMNQPTQQNVFQQSAGAQRQAQQTLGGLANMQFQPMQAAQAGPTAIYGGANIAPTANFGGVILPEESLIDFYDHFTGDAWRELTSALDARSEAEEWPKNELHLPRFSFEFGRPLNDHLQTLGMTDAFDESLANLSGISDMKLVVSSVKQNTFVEVNEEGTEAAAVTTVDIRNTSIPVPFQVNRPFIFVIRERTTNTLLFIGQVTDPSLS